MSVCVCVCVSLCVCEQSVKWRIFCGFVESWENTKCKWSAGEKRNEGRKARDKL